MKVSLRLFLIASLVVCCSCSNKEKFFEEVKAANAAAVEEHLARGMEPDARDHNRRTALMLAAFEGHNDIVNIMLDKGADLHARDVDGWTVLMYAAYGGRLETVQLLIEKGAKVNAAVNSAQTVLMIAAQKGYTDVGKLLIDKSANMSAKDQDGRSAIMWAEKGGHTKFGLMIQEQEILARTGGTAPKPAAPTNRKTPKRLLDYAKAGNVTMVKQLVGGGADTEVRDHNRRTPLMLAAFEGHNEVIKALLNAGADLDARDVDGWEALTYAVYGNRIETVRLLIDEGADINSRTVKAVAIDKGGQGIMELLHQEGMDF